MTNKYSQAYVEVLELLKTIPLEEYNKIPKEKIKFFEENKDKNYNFTLDTSKEISQQDISKEANAIIVLLFRDYFATEVQKEKLNKILLSNEEKKQEELRKKYNPDDIFRKKEITEKEICTQLIEIKEESILKKIFNWIKSLWKK